MLAGRRIQGAHALKRRKDRSCEDTTAARIIQILTRNPGLTCSELADRLDRNESTVLYHLRRLCRGGDIHIVKAGRVHRAFADQARTQIPRCEWGTYAILSDPINRMLIDYLRGRPARIQGDVARRLRLSPSRLSERASRLEEAGLIERWREPEGNAMRATSKAAALIDMVARHGQAPAAKPQIETTTA